MIQENIFLKIGKNIEKLQVADILYAEANRNNIRIFCKDDVWELRMSLGILQSKMPANSFVRVHRSYLIAIDHISFYRNGMVYLGEFEIPVQRDKINEFLDALNIINRNQGIQPKRIPDSQRP